MSRPKVIAPAVAEKVCRTCGEDVSLATSLLLPQHRHLVKWVERNLTLQVNEENGLPHSVCIRCLDHIQDWISFYTKCKHVQRTFKKKGDLEPLSVATSQHPETKTSENLVTTAEIPKIDKSLSSNEASNENTFKLRKQPSRQSKRTNNGISNDLFSYDAILDEILRSDEDSDKQTSKIINKIPKLRKKKCMSQTKPLNKSKSITNNEILKSNSHYKTRKSSVAKNKSEEEIKINSIQSPPPPPIRMEVDYEVTPILSQKVPVITKNPNLVNFKVPQPQRSPFQAHSINIHAAIINNPEIHNENNSFLKPPSHQDMNSELTKSYRNSSIWDPNLPLKYKSPNSHYNGDQNNGVIVPNLECPHTMTSQGFDIRNPDK